MESVIVTPMSKTYFDCNDCGQPTHEGESVNGYCPLCVDRFALRETTERLRKLPIKNLTVQQFNDQTRFIIEIAQLRNQISAHTRPGSTPTA